MALNDFGQPGLVDRVDKQPNTNDDPGGVVEIEEYPSPQGWELSVDLGDLGDISSEQRSFVTMFMRETVLDHTFLALSGWSPDAAADSLTITLYKDNAVEETGDLTDPGDVIAQFTVENDELDLVVINWNGTDEADRTFQAGEALFIGIVYVDDDGVGGVSGDELGDVRIGMMGRNFRNG